MRPARRLTDGVYPADGRRDLVEASRFADLLRQARPAPRLVVLNSCSGATAGGGDLFAGTAAALARAGVPAVVAMQFEITDAAAAVFARGFYTALAQGRDGRSPQGCCMLRLTRSAAYS